MGLICSLSTARFTPESNVSPNAKLTLFFEGVLGALEQLRSNRATYLANEYRRLYRGALAKVLTKVALWNTSVNFADVLESLPEEADLTVLKERIKPIINCVDGVEKWGA